MVLGTSSGAGKSWIATALCRHWANQGLKVAPFKAQNMSNNARVVASGVERWAFGVQREPSGAPRSTLNAPRSTSLLGEIGSAQYFQALAARAVPDVRMNPLLLKPEADTRSQVVLLGQVDRELSALPWRGRSERVWPAIAAALDALRAENDVVVIEGAGSPAELNLMASDVVNLRVARHADARCLLVADIDRGGALAHLYGTWALLPPEDRARLRGFVLNKFRGDAALLAPGPEQLQQLTGVPTLAVVPMHFGHGLPEEDGVFDDRARGSGAVHTRVAVVAYPRISNLDEFQPLKNVAGVRLTWARSPAELDGVDWIILPGSKATAADLAWLRAQGLDAAIAQHAARGGRVLGICGGLQMLGEALIDLHGIEPEGNGPGLGLLPLVTRFEPHKTVRHAHARFGDVTGPWSALAGVAVSGYEIHSGQTAQHPAMAAKGDVARELLPGLAWQNVAGNVLGVYLHGLFEDPAVLHALFGAGAPTLDTVFERLAATLQSSFTPGALDALIR
ncbi:MAG: cobyric acid synthase [Burkholderiales bacterium]|nr:cobyric acid synthase [Burkholderiales bacterium]